jgi:hypothetical protein
MDLKQELATALSTFASGNLPREESVELLLKNTATRQQLLTHPRLTAALARRATLGSGLTCTEVEDSLAGVIDAEGRGDKVQAEYDQLMLHLHLCAECYEVYRAATDILAAQATGVLPRWPQATIPPARPTATIVLSRAMIQSKLSTWQKHRSARVRGSSASQQLLYAGDIPEHPDLFARVILSQPKEAGDELWRITVDLSGPAALMKRQISLRCGSETHSSYTDTQGVALFAGIPKKWLMPANASDLQISVDYEPTI